MSAGQVFLDELDALDVRHGRPVLFIVLLIGCLTGIILSLETARQLQRFGQVHLVAGLVALSMARSLGPLLTAIVVTGRVGPPIRPNWVR